MDLELKIENFGPIDEAAIQVGRFTIFAGANNTGKTFVSKMLYSILGAINANHARVFFDSMARPAETDLQRIEESGPMIGKRPLAAIRSALQKIDSILREAFPSQQTQNELEKLETVQPALMAEIKGIKTHVQALKNNIETKEKGESDILSSAFDSLKNTIDILETGFNSAESAFRFGWRLRCYQNVSGNFQESVLAKFEGEGEASLSFSVEGVGKLQGTDGISGFNPCPEIFQNKQWFTETFYLESPIYWKLKNALESIQIDPRSPFRDTLNGVPDYFYDVAVALRRKRTEHPLHFFGKLHKSLHNVIGGRISLSETGDLEFHEKDKSVPLSLVSAGVANMGMLALLIERGALDQRSFLFIDEPESNLHPAWQVEMAEFLFELARQGVNVVVSTHSMTILKWLEVHVKEEPEDRELVKLNKFPPDAEWNDDMDAVMAEVKKSLTKPFSDLYIQGLQQGQPKRRSHRGNRLGENDSRFQRKVRLPQRRRPN